MRKIAILLIIVLASCKSAEEKENERVIKNLNIYFKENYLDSTMTVDNFNLYKIDTITEKTKLWEQYNDLSDKTELVMEYLRLNYKSISNISETAALYKFIGGDLLEQERRKLLNLQDKSKIINNELDTLISMRKLLLKKIPKSDSILSIGYQAVCNFQVRFKDQSIRQDTAYIFLNKDKNIVKKFDLIKPTYTVNFDKFSD